MTSTRLADALLWTSAAVAVCGIVGSLQSEGFPGNGDSWTLGAVAIGFCLLGRLVVSRQPTLPIGWLLLAGGAVQAWSLLASWWALQGLVGDPGSLPLTGLAAWLAVWLAPLPWVLVLAAPLVLFPDGTPRSAAWQRFLFAVATVVGTLVVATAIVALPVAVDDPLQLVDLPGIPRGSTAELAIGLRATARWVGFGATIDRPRRSRHGVAAGQRNRASSVLDRPHRRLRGDRLLRHRGARARRVGTTRRRRPKRSTPSPSWLSPRRLPLPSCATGSTTSEWSSAARCSSSSSACCSRRCTSPCSSCWPGCSTNRPASPSRASRPPGQWSWLPPPLFRGPRPRPVGGSDERPTRRPSRLASATGADVDGDADSVVERLAATVRDELRLGSVEITVIGTEPVVAGARRRAGVVDAPRLPGTRRWHRRRHRAAR